MLSISWTKDLSILTSTSGHFLKTKHEVKSIEENINNMYLIMCYFKVAHNVRVYDQLRPQSDFVSRYTKVPQSDSDSDLMPSN